MNDDTRHVDVLIIGAGISGIAAACHMQRRCPGLTFAILEARQAFGGTWDLFRYPGIRSDSDMFTLGFSFKPWNNPESIADGSAIMAYLRETIEENDLARHIRYGVRVEHAAWSSEQSGWTVRTREGDTSGAWRARFLWSCTGYYRYSAGYTPDFPGLEDFEGDVVHPQLWRDDTDYEGRRVVVIGSGATAVTLAPALAPKAAHVTMLQRSPSYVVSLPGEDPFAIHARRLLPERWAYAATRWKNILYALSTYQLARWFPDKLRQILTQQVRDAVGDGCDVDTHFSPDYAPWDQRLCIVPDNDLFDAIRRGDVELVTDHIERFVPEGIVLRSGETLEADLVVTATGLQIELFGGASVEVDGERVEARDCYMYKGMMLSGVPNVALSVGYTNASWTLKIELICEYVCRLLNHMQRNDYTRCCPTLPEGGLEDQPLMDMSSGYIQRAKNILPKQGLRPPWRLYQNYLVDRVMIRHGRLEDGFMRFSR